MTKNRVGVLRGGPSNEYAVSLNSGAAVLRALRDRFEDEYISHDVLIDRNGDWHIDGLAVAPEKVLPRIDAAFNALHGSYGEDGKIQSFFETHDFPFTGSGSLASAIGMNKILAKNIFDNHGVKTPIWKEISSDRVRENSDAVVRELFLSFILPAMVKPASSGSSVGISVVRRYGDFSRALAIAAEEGDSILVEEYIPGIEASCAVIEDFRGQELYALPPIEIRFQSEFFDYQAKYGGKSEEIVPATFSEKIKNSIEELSRSIHRALNLRHYSRSDFIVHPRRGVYVLEVNTLPGLTDDSLLPKALRAVGSDIHEFVGHVVGLAINNKKANEL